MCLISSNFAKENDFSKGDSLKFVLFGGMELNFQNSVMEITVKFDSNTFEDLSKVNDDNFDNVVSVTTESINKKQLKINKPFEKNKLFSEFGYETTVAAGSDDLLIITIGGSESHKNMISVWNYNKHEITNYPKSLPLLCGHGPATKIYDQYIECIYDKTHFRISIDEIVLNIDQAGAIMILRERVRSLQFCNF